MKSSQDKLLLFLHIPKTGGMTLASILHRRFAENEVLTFSKGGKKLEEELRRAVRERGGYLKLLACHMPFGWHEYFNTPSQYITMVRNPLQRIVSHYYQVVRNPTHYLHDMVKNRNMSLHQYVQSELSPELDNGQTRFISGTTKVKIGQCTQSMLEVALHNLREHFLVAGLTERFNETLLLIYRKLGWSGFPLTSKRMLVFINLTSPNSPSRL
jgi:hypothetical protein